MTSNDLRSINKGPSVTGSTGRKTSTMRLTLGPQGKQIACTTMGIHSQPCKINDVDRDGSGWTLVHRIFASRHSHLIVTGQPGMDTIKPESTVFSPLRASISFFLCWKLGTFLPLLDRSGSKSSYVNGLSCKIKLMSSGRQNWLLG